MAPTRGLSGFEREVVREFDSWQQLVNYLQTAESVICTPRHLLTLCGRSRWSTSAGALIERELADRGLYASKDLQGAAWVRVMPAEGLLTAVHEAISRPSPSGEGLLAALGIVDSGEADDLPHPMIAIGRHLHSPRPRVDVLRRRLQGDFGDVTVVSQSGSEATFGAGTLGLGVDFPTDWDDYLTTASRVLGTQRCYDHVSEWYYSEDGWDFFGVYWEIASAGVISWMPNFRPEKVDVRFNRRLPSIVTFRCRGAIDFLACPPALEGHDRIRRNRTGRWELLPTDDGELGSELTIASCDAYWALA